MAKLYNLARMTTATVGTGTITLGSAATVNGVLYLSFAAAGVVNGDVVSYAIADTNNSETGTGTYTSAGTTLTRTVTTSTNGNAAISLTGSAQVFITARAQDINTAGQTPGTTTNDNANAGNIGEYISANLPLGSAVSLTSGVAANVTSVSLTAGDWDCQGNVAFNNVNAATVQTFSICWLSTTSATLPTAPNGGAYSQWAGSVTGNGPILPTGPTRLSLASTTTLFLGAEAFFTVNTATAYGFVGCRRAR